MKRWIAAAEHGDAEQSSTSRQALRAWLASHPLPDAAGRPEDLALAAARLRVRYALFLLAQRSGQTPAINAELDALRGEAWPMRRSTDAQVEAVAEYWLMMLDLVPVRRLAKTPGEALRMAATRMEELCARLARFGEPLTPVAQVIVRHCRLALLAIHDRLGRSDDVSRQLQWLTDHPAEQGQPPDLNRYAYSRLIGREVAIRVTCQDGRRWDAADHRGEVVVICFWPGPGPGLGGDLLRQLGAMRVSVLVVDLSGAGATGWALPALPWPVYRQTQGEPQLTDMLGVRELPRLAVIDRQGRLAAVGGAAMIEDLPARLDQLAGDTPASP
ncbi:MAG: hypothetical protein IT440_02330 [Phycisphaeraceae bacterium]|nr:hypothetical protein [Phycisphaeraceae bacterium]